MPDQVGDSPALVATLYVLRFQRDDLRTAETAPEQQRDDRSISLPTERVTVHASQQHFTFGRRKPIADATTKLGHTLDQADAGNELGAEQTGIGSLVSEAANGGEPDVYGGRGQKLRFQFHSIAEDDAPVQCESGFGTIPVDEFVHRVFVRASRLHRREAVKDGLLGLVQFGKGRPIERRDFLDGVRFISSGLRSRSSMFARQRSERCTDHRLLLMNRAVRASNRLRPQLSPSVTQALTVFVGQNESPRRFANYRPSLNCFHEKRCRKRRFTGRTQQTRATLLESDLGRLVGEPEHGRLREDRQGYLNERRCCALVLPMLD